MLSAKNVLLSYLLSPKIIIGYTTWKYVAGVYCINNNQSFCFLEPLQPFSPLSSFPSLSW